MHIRVRHGDISHLFFYWLHYFKWYWILNLNIWSWFYFNIHAWLWDIENQVIFKCREAKWRDHSGHVYNGNLEIMWLRLVLTANVNITIGKPIVIALLQLSAWTQVKWQIKPLSWLLETLGLLHYTLKEELWFTPLVPFSLRPLTSCVTLSLVATQIWRSFLKFTPPHLHHWKILALEKLKYKSPYKSPPPPILYFII